MNKLLLIIIISSSFYLQGSSVIQSEVFSEIMSKKTCKLGDAKLKEKKLIEVISNLLMGDNEEYLAGIFKIEEVAFKNNLSCYMKVNLTASYAYAANKDGSYSIASKLYYKATTFKGLPKEIKEKFISRAVRAERHESEKPSSFIKNNDLDEDVLDEVVDDGSSNLVFANKRIEELEESIKDKEKKIIKLEAINNENSNFNEPNLLIAQERVKSLETKIQILQSEVSIKNQELERLNARMDKLVSSLSDGIRSEDLSLNGNSEVNESSIEIYIYVLLTIIIFLAYFIYNTLYSNNSSSTNSVKPELDTPNDMAIKELENILVKIPTWENPRFKEEEMSIFNEYNSLEDYLYGYCEGFSNRSHNNEIDIGFMMDELIQIIFKNKELVSIKSHYRFLESSDLDQGKKEGSEDAMFFKRNGKLKRLEEKLF